MTCDLWNLRQAVESVRRPVAVFQGRPGHHADQPRLLVHQRRHPPRLVEELRRLDLGLQEDDLVHRYRAVCGAKVRGQVGAVQQGDVVQPGISEPADVPEVDVSVDNAEVEHETLPRLSFTGAPRPRARDSTRSPAPSRTPGAMAI